MVKILQQHGTEPCTSEMLVGGAMTFRDPTQRLSPGSEDQCLESDTSGKEGHARVFPQRRNVLSSTKSTT